MLMRFLNINIAEKNFVRPLVFAFVFILYTLYPLPSASAATIALDPSSGSFSPGDTFVTTVRLELEKDECVNATTIELLYPKELVKASAVSKGESLLTLWPEEPHIDHDGGVVSFSGGVPAGYCGRVLGDPGKTNILAKIIFRIDGIPSGTTLVPVPFSLKLGERTQVLLNDGLGTPATFSFRGVKYERTPVSSSTKNEWLNIVDEDKAPPDLFEPEIVQDSQTFQGKYFLIFSTVDKQSGVHHYEILEDDPRYIGRVRGGTEKAVFITATSPYVLRDQELGSRITVRAIDHAGNVQESILPPAGEGAVVKTVGGSVSPLWWYGFATLGVIIVIGTLLFFIRSRGATHSRAVDNVDIGQ